MRGPFSLLNRELSRGDAEKKERKEKKKRVLLSALRGLRVSA
jgi:hypothetical protein